MSETGARSTGSASFTDETVSRDDKSGQRDNVASPAWEGGDAKATDLASVRQEAQDRAAKFAPATK